MGSGGEAAVFGLRLALTLANARKASSTSTASHTTARIRPTRICRGWDRLRRVESCRS